MYRSGCSTLLIWLVPGNVYHFTCGIFAKKGYTQLRYSVSNFFCFSRFVTLFLAFLPSTRRKVQGIKGTYESLASSHSPFNTSTGTCIFFTSSTTLHVFRLPTTVNSLGPFIVKYTVSSFSNHRQTILHILGERITLTAVLVRFPSCIDPT